jgi:hypothetical protein
VPTGKPVETRFYTATQERIDQFNNILYQSETNEKFITVLRFNQATRASSTREKNESRPRLAIFGTLTRVAG